MKSQLFCMTILFSVLIIAISISTRPSSAYEIVAAWTMDEGQGREIHDSSDNGHTGEFFGDPE